MKQIYLDYAAATPLDPAVLAAMEPYFSEQFHNPSATYLAGKDVRKSLENARSSVAAALGARAGEIVFTAGATEANNLAIQGLMKRFPDGEVLVSAVEHESVLVPAGLFKSKKIPVNQQATIDLTKLQKMINNKTVLVSVMLVNNELGTIQPLRKIAKILNKLSISRKAAGNDRPLYLHSDAAQAPCYLDLHVSRLGVDMLTINGGKIYGPKQSGALFVKAGIELQPLILGGGQERNLRSGTENVTGIVGFAKALELAQQKRTAESQRINTLRDFFAQELQNKMPQAVINGSTKHYAPHILSVTFPGVDNERLMMQLDEAGVQVAVGSACSASSDEPSHVLTAIGLSDQQARSTLRYSFGDNTRLGDIKRAVDLLAVFTVV